MKKLMSLMFAGAMMAGMNTAQADVGVGVKGGMLGLGAELTVGMTDTLNGRLGYNTYTFNTSATESDIKYDIDMKWQTTALLLDWHPGGGGFRLTAGYMLNGNKLQMKAKESGSYKIGDTTYTADISLQSDVSFNNAPYIGLGWGNAAKRKGFGFIFEAGAMYQGAPKVSIEATCSGACAGFDEDIAKEESNLEGDLDGFKWYPQVAFGVSYSF